MKNSLLVKSSLTIALGMSFVIPSGYAQQGAPIVHNLKTCPGTTTALASSLQEATPAGYTLQWWKTGNRQSGTRVSNPAAVGGGTYYAFYVADTGGDISPASAVDVTYYQSGDVVIGQVGGNDFNWNYPSSSLSTIADTITQPGTSYGFTFDIYSLDNSFNMEINGVKLATKEIQFQSSGTSGINVEFADGDQYETNTGGDIWQMQGSAQAPLIRVSLNPDGVVSLYGSKVSNGTLFTLQPIADSFAFNTIPWNQDAENTIIVTQKVTGVTSMNGTGYGLDTLTTACPILDITAINDTFMFNQGDTSVSVLENDSLDGLTPNTETVTTAVGGSVPAGFTLNTDGTVDIDASVAPGTYTFDYQVCVRGAVPPDCDIATVTIVIGTPLPIGLLYFDVQQSDQNVLLSWTTSSEQDNAGFGIEHSSDGKSWDEIGFVKSNARDGFSNAALNYSFTDRAPFAGNNFYRLKQTNINGTVQFSPVRSLVLNNTAAVSIYPNPVKENITIAGLKGKNTIYVSNSLGQVLIRETSAKDVKNLSTAQLAPGIYMITVQNENNNRYNYKMVKQ